MRSWLNNTFRRNARRWRARHSAGSESAELLERRELLAAAGISATVTSTFLRESEPVSIQVDDGTAGRPFVSPQIERIRGVDKGAITLIEIDLVSSDIRDEQVRESVFVDVADSTSLAVSARCDSSEY